MPDDLIREQWDGLMRVTDSLRSSHSAPDVVVQRLVNASELVCGLYTDCFRLTSFF